MNTTILKATMASLALMMSTTVFAASIYVYDKNSGSAAKYGDLTIYNMTSGTVSLSNTSQWGNTYDTGYNDFLVNGKGTIQPYSALQGTNLEFDTLSSVNASARQMSITIQEPTLKSGQTLANNPNYQGNSYDFTLNAGYYSGGRTPWWLVASTSIWTGPANASAGSVSTSGAKPLGNNVIQIYNASYVVTLLACVGVDSTNGLDGSATGNTQIALLISPNFPGIFSQNAVASQFCPLTSDDKDNQAAYNKF